MRRESVVARVAVLVFVALSLVSAGVWAETFIYVDSTGRQELVDSSNPGRLAWPATAPQAIAKAGGVTFNVQYQDVIDHNGRGFDDPTNGAARRARLNDLFFYLSSILNHNGACDVLFEPSLTSGSGALATGGTSFSSTPGLTNGIAFDHITTGVDQAPGMADISVTVNFGYPWYAGTGLPSFSQFDLKTVLVHELTHGLGLLTLSTSTGGTDLPGITNVYSVWDSQLATGNGQVLFGDSPPSFLGVVSDLVGSDNGVVFRGTNATTAFGANPPVYAPNPWESGSSLSHWDLGITGGAVMEPAVAPGAVLRTYKPVDSAGLKDIGYTVLPASGPTPDFSATPLFGEVPLTVQFTDLSDPGSAVIYQWQWDFGDGSPVSTAQSPSHTYTVAGKYTVTLTVRTDINVASLQQVQYINVGGFMITQSPKGGWYEAGQRLALSVTVSGAIGTVDYQWIKDGAPISGETSPTLVIDPLSVDDTGFYSVQVTDQAPSVEISVPVKITVFPEGGLPAMGIVGLCVVAVACVVAGAFVILRPGKKKSNGH